MQRKEPEHRGEAGMSLACLRNWRRVSETGERKREGKVRLEEWEGVRARRALSVRVKSLWLILHAMESYLRVLSRGLT